jgi:endogenous inhibitor of DNA gyrase (YacG/DUF329 family)
MDSTTNAPSCAHCGKPLSSPDRVYCNLTCRNRATNERRYGAPQILTCKHCGQPFKKRSRAGGKDANLYCSKRCFHAQRTANRKPEPETFPLTTCVVCGAEFRRTRGSKYCSDECSKVEARRRVARPHPLVNATCKTCGKQFSYRRYNNTKLFCGARCAKKAFEQAHPEWAAQRKREMNQRRRARKRGVVVEYFTHREIYERDGWRCGICGRKVNKRLKYPHLLSASLDHIIPLGPPDGNHVRANVQCSHFICNSRKSSNDGGQMRLIE